MAKNARGALPEPNDSAGKRRGRKPNMPLSKEVELAYGHLHNLDWLQECSLTRLPSVQERIPGHQFMPEAQALRELLVEAAEQVIQESGRIPSMANVRLFLQRYLQGHRVVDIAGELGVSRPWCSRYYRKEAFRLAGMQFARNVSFRQ